MRKQTNCSRTNSQPLETVVDPGFLKRGGIKYWMLVVFQRTQRWVVVKNSASPNRPFGVFGGIFSFLGGPTV